MFCPNCGTQIPDTASFCPNCGSVINNKSSKIQPEPKQPKKGGMVGKILLIALAVVLGMGLKAVLSGQNNSSAEYNPPVKDDTYIDTGVDQKTKDYENWLKGDLSSSNSSEAGDTSETGQGTYEEDLMPTDIENLTTVLFDDFIYPERLIEDGMPKNAEPMELYDATGAWKYELIQLNSEDGFKEIGSCKLDFGQNDVLFDLYPTKYMFANEIYNTTREETGYGTYKGHIESGAFSLADDVTKSTLMIGPFYRIEGTEFGFGSLVTYNDTILTILMTRP